MCWALVELKVRDVVVGVIIYNSIIAHVRHGSIVALMSMWLSFDASMLMLICPGSGTQ